MVVRTNNVHVYTGLAQKNDGKFNIQFVHIVRTLTVCDRTHAKANDYVLTLQKLRVVLELVVIPFVNQKYGVMVIIHHIHVYTVIKTIHIQ